MGYNTVINLCSRGLALLTLSITVLFAAGIYVTGARAEATTHYMDFVLKEHNFTRLCVTKAMMVVNGMFPGPTITVRKGDTVYVNVFNNGAYGVTIHWHGVLQPRNPWHDGPNYITQCVIEPGSNFTYELNFSTEEGTVWWHAHSDWTRASVHGAIVVRPAEGTSHPFPEPDGEEVLVMGSWYSDDLVEILNEDLESGVDLPTSDCYTINGQPGDFESCSNESIYRWSVDYGKTYLLKLLNADMNAELFVGIADHNVTVVGMDGAYVKPFESNYIMIAPGQTIDVLLNANQTPSHYYIIARQYISGLLSYEYFDFTNASAILQYNGNYTAPERPIFPSLPNYYNIGAADDFRVKWRSLADEDHPIDVPMNITTRMYITVSVNQYLVDNATTVRMSSSLNNLSWVNPSMDVLTAYYRNMSGFYTSDFPDDPLIWFDFTGVSGYDVTPAVRATKLKVLNYGEEVEIVFQGTNVFNSSIDHPMHLHGYSTYLVGEGRGNYDFGYDPKTYNLEDPPFVNTIPAPKNGWVAVRFKATNPGVWLLHCHFDRHFSWGMNTVLIVKNGPTPETSMKEPPAYMPSCKADSHIKYKAGSDGEKLLPG